MDAWVHCIDFAVSYKTTGSVLSKILKQSASFVLETRCSGLFG